MENFTPPLSSKAVLKTYTDKKQVCEREDRDLGDLKNLMSRKGKCSIHSEGPRNKKSHSGHTMGRVLADAWGRTDHCAVRSWDQSDLC